MKYMDKMDCKMDYKPDGMDDCCHPKWTCKCDDYKDDMCDMDCEMPKMKCKTEKECVKVYKCCYKLYRVCQYRLYKVCPRCGHEYDYHQCRGICTKCGN